MRRRGLRVLVDCIPLTGGGGIQVAIALVTNLQRDAGMEWQAVFPSMVRSTLPLSLSSDARVHLLPRRSILDRLWLGPKMRAFEASFKPDLVFTVFGPAFYRANAPHLVGFALPHLIYAPELPVLHRHIGQRLADDLRCRSNERTISR